MIGLALVADPGGHRRYVLIEACCGFFELLWSIRRATFPRLAKDGRIYVADYATSFWDPICPGCGREIGEPYIEDRTPRPEHA